MKYYICGHADFQNRGCEALVRSLVKLVREREPEAIFLCPSTNPALDLGQWPTAGEHGVRFVPAPRFPELLLWWDRLHRRLPRIARLSYPATSVDADTRAAIDEADAVIMTGGDNISLDYGTSVLLFWSGIVDYAHRVGKPVHMWANSVGPFASDPTIERRMKDHLSGYMTITARETETVSYLAKLGVADVPLVADPAFLLDPEPTPALHIETNGRRLLGINVSPLVRRFRASETSRREFDTELASFLNDLASLKRYHILLVPHVHPWAGNRDKSDYGYLQRLLQLSGVTNDITLLPANLNAAQTKSIIGRCCLFIGARTHATIAALSLCVPTLSIAYSRKAVGINKDLFGHLDYVIPTPDVSRHSMWQALNTIERSEDRVRNTLSMRIPEWHQRARDAARIVIN